MDKFYTCLPHMEGLFEKSGRKKGLVADTLEEYEVWKKRTRKVLSRLIGLQKMENCALEAKLLERVEIMDGIIREKVLLQVEPSVYMPVFILIPANPVKKNGKPQCFMAPPGHDGGGKFSVAGFQEHPLIRNRIAKYNYDYGLQLAKRGYVTLCPDCRGFGERREIGSQDEGSIVAGSCYQLAHMAEPLGRTVVGMAVWDLMRLIDYIEERGEWDSDSIGCIGFSGGGMQTLWISALCDKIKYPIIGSYLYGYKDSLLKLNNNCNCNYVPRLWEQVDMGDIGALLAPRILMVQSCRADHLNGEGGIDNVFTQMKIIRKAYRFYNKEANIYHDICEGGHKWHEENLSYFLDNFIKADEKEVP